MNQIRATVTSPMTVNLVCCAIGQNLTPHSSPSLVVYWGSWTHSWWWWCTWSPRWTTCRLLLRILNSFTVFLCTLSQHKSKITGLPHTQTPQFNRPLIVKHVLQQFNVMNGTRGLSSTACGINKMRCNLCTRIYGRLCSRWTETKYMNLRHSNTGDAFAVLGKRTWPLLDTLCSKKINTVM